MQTARKKNTMIQDSDRRGFKWHFFKHGNYKLTLLLEYDGETSAKCANFSIDTSLHSTAFAKDRGRSSTPVKWAGGMKTALCPSPPSCGGTPTEGFPGGGSALPWISPPTLSCWCRDGQQWTPPRSPRWSPRAGDKWGRGRVRGQQKCAVKIECRFGRWGRCLSGSRQLKRCWILYSSWLLSYFKALVKLCRYPIAHQPPRYIWVIRETIMEALTSHVPDLHDRNIY